MIKVSRSFMIGLFIMIFGISCAHLPGFGVSDEEALRERVVRVWEAKIKKDWGTVYDLTWEEFKKEVSREQFVGAANLEVNRFEIKDLEIRPEERRATVMIRFDMTYLGFQLRGTEIKEEWMREAGSWFLIQRPITNFFGKK